MQYNNGGFMKKIEEKILEKTVDMADKVYEDGAQSFVKESGVTLALIPQAINAALVPFRKWIIEREYSFKKTQALLEKKLQNKDVEDIVAPESYIAVPALQAISYSMDNEVLRNMYANLLANSMDINFKDSVHPSFVDIIKQMSPNDAKIYKEIYLSKVRPIMDLSMSIDNSGQNDYLYDITWIDSFDYETIAVCISNLVRMGLIEIDNGSSYTVDSNYDLIRNKNEYIQYKQKYDNVPNVKISESKHFIKITALGKLFYTICVKDY